MNRIRSHRMPTGHSGAAAAAAVALCCGALLEGVLGASVQTKHWKWLHFPLLFKVLQSCTLNRASSVTTFNQQTREQFFPCVRHTSHCNTALWGVSWHSFHHGSVLEQADRPGTLAGQRRAWRSRAVLNSCDPKHPDHLTDSDLQVESAIRSVTCI